MTKGRDSEGKFVEGNKAAQKHGGAGAVRALTYDKPFTGLAAKEQQRVEADLDAGGRSAMVEELAVRLHTAARLYWSAVAATVARADDDDGLTGLALEQLKGHAKTFGFLANSALRAWREHREEEAATPATLDYDELVKELQNA